MKKLSEIKSLKKFCGGNKPLIEELLVELELVDPTEGKFEVGDVWRSKNSEWVKKIDRIEGDRLWGQSRDNAGITYSEGYLLMSIFKDGELLWRDL